MFVTSIVSNLLNEPVWNKVSIQEALFFIFYSKLHILILHI